MEQRIPYNCLCTLAHSSYIVDGLTHPLMSATGLLRFLGPYTLSHSSYVVNGPTHPLMSSTEFQRFWEHNEDANGGVHSAT